MEKELQTHSHHDFVAKTYESISCFIDIAITVYLISVINIKIFLDWQLSAVLIALNSLILGIRLFLFVLEILKFAKERKILLEI